MRVPPGVSSKDFSDALQQFEEAVGKEWVFTSDEDVAMYRDAYSPFWGEPDELVGIGGGRARWRRAGAEGRTDREHLQDSDLPNLDGQEPRVRWVSARVFGQRSPRPEANEPDSRGQREERVLPRGTRRQLFRSLPLHSGKWNQAVGRRSRSRMGQPGRQFSRSRRRLFAAAISKSLRFALRDGSRAGEWRGAAHGHGRASRRENLAGVQVRIRAVDRRDFFAVQFRRRDENGILDVPRAGFVSGRARSRCRDTTISSR